jgi:hypothetical protein
MILISNSGLSMYPRHNLLETAMFGQQLVGFTANAFILKTQNKT